MRRIELSPALRWATAAAALLGSTGCGLVFQPRPAPPGPPVFEELVRAAPRPAAATASAELAASPLSLALLLEQALARNAGLEAARRRWLAAQARPAHQGALPDPMVSLKWMIEHVVTRNGPIEQTFMLQQPIPFPGKLVLSARIAEQEALAAWERYMTSGLALIAEVKKAYYELYWVERAIEITGENKRLVEQLLQVAQTKFAAGQVTQQDVLKAQIEQARLANETETLADLRRAVQARLNRALNRPPAAPLGRPAAFEAEPIALALEPLLALALEQRPELREARRAVQAAAQGERLAGLEYVPDLVAGFEYSVIDRVGLMGTTDDGQDAYGFSFMLRLPIWLGKNAARVHEAHQQLRARQLALAQLEHDTRAALADAYYRAQIALRQVQLYRDNIVPQARQALEVSQTAYAAVPARVDFDTVIDNVRRLLGFWLTLERARADVQQWRAELERLVGGVLAERGR
ncbi:MAG: PTS cellobiose transporter subunit IIC [Planctomycetota bacterium]|nr:MAG: PTS cellobiose transporter subunit IIC [Planctomycetota bacterium]